MHKLPPNVICTFDFIGVPYGTRIRVSAVRRQSEVPGAGAWLSPAGRTWQADDTPGADDQRPRLNRRRGAVDPKGSVKALWKKWQKLGHVDAMPLVRGKVDDGRDLANSKDYITIPV
jgi:hypothetical protein